MSSTKKHNGEIRDSYLEMVKKFPLASIGSDAELKEAQQVLDSLFENEPLDEGEEMYLEALSDLIAHYEARHVRIDPPSDSAVLLHLMEAKGVTQKEVAVATGISKSTICEVLSGNRKFTRPQIAKVARYFAVEQGVFRVQEA